MSDEIDPGLAALYRAAAREEPSAQADARVLAAARPRERLPPVLWAEAAVVALLIGAAAMSLAPTPAGPPSPDDPRYFGLYAGREESLLLALGNAPDPVADGLLQAGRPPHALKE